MNLLTTDEAAEVLRLSRRTLEGWRVKGGGPPFCRFGKDRGRVFYIRRDLDAWVDEQTRTSTSDRGPTPTE